MRLRQFAILLLAFTGVAARAQDSMYVGVGIGSFDYKEDLTSAVLGNVSGNVSSYKLLGGLAFNEHFAMEISYAETDDIVHSVNANIPPFGNLDYVLVTDFTKTTMRAIGQIPFEWGALLGGVGFFTSDNDFRENGTVDCCAPLMNSGTISENGSTAMLGIEWRFGQFDTRFGIRLEYEWWDIDNVDASALGLAVSYGF